MKVFWQVLRWFGQGVISVSGLATAGYSIAAGATDSVMWGIPWEGWAIGGVSVLAISLIYVVIRLSIRLHNLSSPDVEREREISERKLQQLRDAQPDVQII